MSTSESKDTVGDIDDELARPSKELVELQDEFKGLGIKAECRVNPRWSNQGVYGILLTQIGRRQLFSERIVSMASALRHQAWTDPAVHPAVLHGVSSDQGQDDSLCGVKSWLVRHETIKRMKGCVT